MSFLKITTACPKCDAPLGPGRKCLCGWQSARWLQGRPWLLILLLILMLLLYYILWIPWFMGGLAWWSIQAVAGSFRALKAIRYKKKAL